MNTLQRVRGLIPAWTMPQGQGRKSATLWFLHWLLHLVVNFFWLAIIVAVVVRVATGIAASGAAAGIGGGFATLFEWLFIWAVLYGLLKLVDITAGVSRIVSDVKRMQQQQHDFLRQSQSYSPFIDTGDLGGMNDLGSRSQPGEREKVVDGTITEIREEPPQQRQSH